MRTYQIYFIKDRDGRYLGPRGWVDDANDAKAFDASDALQKLYDYPNTEAVVAGAYELDEEPETADVAA